MTVRYRATVEYDGTDFAGFQVNPGKRTVQGVLEDAVQRLGDGVAQRVDGAGRTDAGVHATGQVIAFSYGGRLTATELGAALEALLPRDVAIRDLRRTTSTFQPRYAARYREYRYTVWNGPRSPIRERTALGVRVPLDTAAMERAGSAFIGRHDFSAFGATDRSPVRTVMAVRVRREGRLVTIDVRADSFLRGMVRRMVALLIEVGLGKMDEAAVRAALSARRPALDGAAAPARGLCLRRVALGRRPGERERRTRGTMNVKTIAVKESEIDRRWFVVDATDETLGRLASRIARVLEGKHKPSYQPNLDSGDHVIVLNAAKIAVTSDKLESKLYSRHSGYPQGFKQETLGHLLARRPEEVIRRAVKGMLPHNRLGTQQLRKLKVYPGSDHPHQAQRPEPLA